MHWDSIIDRKMEAAIAEGVFDNLSGKGRPLQLDVNPFVEKGWQLAFDMLKAAGFAPQWIELDREIRERQIQVRKTFRSTLNLYRKGSIRSQSVLDRFHQAVDEIKILIRERNLLVPSSRFSRQLINADSDLEWIQAHLLTHWEKKTDHLAGS